MKHMHIKTERRSSEQALGSSSGGSLRVTREDLVKDFAQELQDATRRKATMTHAVACRTKVFLSRFRPRVGAWYFSENCVPLVGNGGQKVGSEGDSSKSKAVGNAYSSFAAAVDCGRPQCCRVCRYTTKALGRLPCAAV